MEIVAKLIYSLLLAGVAVAMLREVWLTWLDRRVFVGKFDVVSAAGAEEALSAAFPKRVAGAHAVLAQQLMDYQSRRAAADSPSDSTFLLSESVFVPEKLLGGIDVTVQNVNVTQILSALRKHFTSPSEVSGTMTTDAGTMRGYVTWSAPPSLPASQSLASFLVPTQHDDGAAATYIAGSIAWTRAASSDPALARYPRAQFCEFAVALDELYALSHALSTPTGLGEGQIDSVRRRVKELRAYDDAPHIYPDIYRLRADLLDLLPEKVRTREELTDSQEDRLKYAMLSPSIQALDPENRRFAALAMARPAIALEGGRAKDIPANWGSLLIPRESAIRRVANSVGMILGVDGEPVGTGTVVAPGVILTAEYVLKAARTTRSQGRRDDGGVATGPSFCLGDTKSGCSLTQRIGSVLYSATVEHANVVLAELQDHDALLHPAAPIADTVADRHPATGQYAYVVGYPQNDVRLPRQFLEYLLAHKAGVKRLMPGRVLAVGRGLPSGAAMEAKEPAPVVLTTDISTTAGVGGGPLVDLASGKIIGISVAGQWKGERGKFAYAAALPKGVVDFIATRLAEQAATGPDSPGPAVPLRPKTPREITPARCSRSRSPATTARSRSS